MIQKDSSTTVSSSNLLFDMVSKLAFFGLVFPGLIFFVGLFFVYTGIIRFSAKYTRGKVSANKTIKDYRGTDCVYHRLDIDCYVGGYVGWKRFFSSEDRLPFNLGGKLVHLGNTDIRIPPTRTIIGYLKRKKGFLAKALNTIVPAEFSTLRAKIFNYEAITSPNEPNYLPLDFIDGATTEVLIDSAAISKSIVPHAKKPLRITEYTIPPGSQVILGFTDAKENAVWPFILSTSANPNQIEHLAREKSYLTIFIGAILVLVSLAAYTVLLSHMLI